MEDAESVFEVPHNSGPVTVDNRATAGPPPAHRQQADPADPYRGHCHTARTSHHRRTRIGPGGQPGELQAGDGAGGYLQRGGGERRGRSWATGVVRRRRAAGSRNDPRSSGSGDSGDAGALRGGAGNVRGQEPNEILPVVFSPDGAHSWAAGMTGDVDFYGLFELREPWLHDAPRPRRPATRRGHLLRGGAVLLTRPVRALLAEAQGAGPVRLPDHAGSAGDRRRRVHGAIHAARPAGVSPGERPRRTTCCWGCWATRWRTRGWRSRRSGPPSDRPPGSVFSSHQPQRRPALPDYWRRTAACRSSACPAPRRLRAQRRRRQDLPGAILRAQPHRVPPRTRGHAPTSSCSACWGWSNSRRRTGICRDKLHRWPGRWNRGQRLQSPPARTTLRI